MQTSSSTPIAGSGAARTGADQPAAPFGSARVRQQALARRDPRADGQFYYGVITTGVYCRPTCGARPPLPKNVRFFATAESAERAGFRACKRCQPRGAAPALHIRQLIVKACASLDAAEAPLRLADLAAGAGLSPFHFHRLFRKQVGLTPRQYASARRLHRFGAVLPTQPTVTAAIHEAGYSSSSRFYEASSRALGMSPAQLRRGGAGLQLRFHVRRCSLGHVLVAASDRGICAIALADREQELPAQLRARFPRAAIEPADQRVRDLARQVVAMIDAADVSVDLPLDLVGTAFQQRVWRALRDIPAGTTVTYAELAARIGAPRAVRAVGTACGANPLAVAVPCHRVVRGDGALGGYRWGLARKQQLLARERGQGQRDQKGEPRG